MMGLGFFLSFTAAAFCAYLAGAKRPAHAGIGLLLPLVGAAAIYGARPSSSTEALVVLCVIVGCALMGVWCGHIAHRKNLNVAGYAALGFLLPMFGLVVVACEPAAKQPS